MSLSEMPGLMEAWRRWNAWWWGKILKEAESEGDMERVEYAKWMLEDVLKEVMLRNLTMIGPGGYRGE